MKIDLYTKVVLTVIACCLLYLCLAKSQETAHAQETMDVNIVGVKADLFPPLPVDVSRVSSQLNALPVHVSSINPDLTVPVQLSSITAQTPLIVGLIGTGLNRDGRFTYEQPIPVRVVAPAGNN
ncbi:MAG TPA: hypothetical protein VI455_01105 [Terriglobia bacterium]